MKVICPYCNRNAERVSGRTMHPHREDLQDRMFWRCVPCHAYVGTHKNSGIVPLGTLANEEDRMARRLAHTRFDMLWKISTPPISRGLAYKLLAAHMKLPINECHIGKFNKEQCDKVQKFCDMYNLEKDFKAL